MMPELWEIFCSEHKEQICFLWNPKELLKHYTYWLAFQWNSFDELKEIRNQSIQEKAESNYEG